MPELRFVVVYDLVEDRQRTAVAHLLARFGFRVQESVFECSLDERELERCLAELKKLLAETEGDVRFYRLCAACQKAAFGLGDLEPGADREPWLIV